MGINCLVPTRIVKQTYLCVCVRAFYIFKVGVGLVSSKGSSLLYIDSMVNLKRVSTLSSFTLSTLAGLSVILTSSLWTHTYDELRWVQQTCVRAHDSDGERWVD